MTSVVGDVDLLRQHVFVLCASAVGTAHRELVALFGVGIVLPTLLNEVRRQSQRD
ncbi:hypothetical protein ACOZ4B_08535 [Haloferax prahovense]|uniref:hypothetical protein n=1 Tax=Haloferax prahovense TaxID=381852 RepID=UPI003C7426E2